MEIINKYLLRLNNLNSINKSPRLFKVKEVIWPKFYADIHSRVFLYHCKIGGKGKCPYALWLNILTNRE